MLIPAGIVVIGWDRKSGAVAEYCFPECLSFPPDFVTQVFSAHFQGNLENFTTTVALQVSGRKVVSYLVNIGEKKKCFAILLHKEEKANEWIEPLKALACEVEKRGDLKAVPSLYKKLVLERKKTKL